MIGVQTWNDATMNLKTCHSLLVFSKMDVKLFLKLINTMNYLLLWFLCFSGSWQPKKVDDKGWAL